MEMMQQIKDICDKRVSCWGCPFCKEKGKCIVMDVDPGDWDLEEIKEAIDGKA